MSGGPPYGGGGGGGFGYPRGSSSGRRTPKQAKKPDPVITSGAPPEADQPADPALAAARLAAQEEAGRISDWNHLHRWGQMTNTIANYRRIEQIGEGTYGQVYRAQCLSTGREVALKKIRVTHPGYFGMPPTIIREIKILKALHHRNLVEMVEVVSSKGVEDLDEDDEREDDARRSAKDKANKARRAEKEKAAAADGNGANGSGDNDGKTDPGSATGSPPAAKKDIASMSKSTKTSQSASAKKDRIVDAREGYKGNLFIVLEYVSHDLTGLIDMQVKFTEVQIKTIFRQLLDVLDYMHSAKYVHRDIKSSNILIDSNFRVKLADFGLARCIAPPVWDQPSDE